MGCKNIFIKSKKRDFPQTFGSLRAFGPLSDPFIKTILSKKEDIKMDEQKK
jgi:hypothetical protein